MKMQRKISLAIKKIQKSKNISDINFNMGLKPSLQSSGFYNDIAER